MSEGTGGCDQRTSRLSPHLRRWSNGDTVPHDYRLDTYMVPKYIYLPKCVKPKNLSIFLDDCFVVEVEPTVGPKTGDTTAHETDALGRPRYHSVTG